MKKNWLSSIYMPDFKQHHKSWSKLWTGNLDERLELRDDFAEELLGSLAAVETGSKATSAQKIAEKLGLAW